MPTNHAQLAGDENMFGTAALKKAFAEFDTNGDGLISVDEFLKGIQSIISLALPIRQKLFAYFDKTNIGMVDYKTFLSVHLITVIGVVNSLLIFLVEIRRIAKSISAVPIKKLILRNHHQSLTRSMLGGLL